MQSPQAKCTKGLAVLYAAIIVGIVLAADSGHLGYLRQFYDFPNGDKVGHFILFGVLSLLANLAVLRSRAGRRRVSAVAATSVLPATIIGLEDLSQIWIPTRTFSLLDLMASYTGVALFAWVAFRMSSWKSESQSPAQRDQG